MCLCYNWKNYLFLVLLDWKQDCFLHLKYRALFQLEPPGSSTRLYLEISLAEHIAKGQLPSVLSMHHLTERLLKIRLESWPHAFVYWPFQILRKTFWKLYQDSLILKLIRELLKFKFPFHPETRVGENLNIFGDEICYFKYVLKRFVLSWVICTRCTCSLKQNT